MTDYPYQPNEREYASTITAYRDFVIAGAWSVRVEPDPLGDVNKIVRLMRGGCYDRPACHKRAAQTGQWTGVRVLRRRDLDGTHWTIRRLPGTSGSPVYTLTCEYRQHRMTSSHLSIEAAKAHCDDVERSWCSRSMREYAGGAR